MRRVCCLALVLLLPLGHARGASDAVSARTGPDTPALTGALRAGLPPWPAERRRPGLFAAASNVALPGDRVLIWCASDAYLAAMSVSPDVGSSAGNILALVGRFARVRAQWSAPTRAGELSLSLRI